MHNKKLILSAAFILIAAAIGLTILMPEKKFYHTAYHGIIIAVILLSLLMSIKDILIIVMVASAVVWGMGFFEMIANIHQLLAETAVVIAASAVLGWYEMNYKQEKEKMTLIVNYKKKAIEEIKGKIGTLNKSNHEIMEKTKHYKKDFTAQ